MFCYKCRRLTACLNSARVDAAYSRPGGSMGLPFPRWPTTRGFEDIPECNAVRDGLAIQEFRH